MAMARQQGAGVARSREFWHLFMALSGDASAGVALARTLEHAFDESIGVDYQPACDTGVGRSQLLLHRAATDVVGKRPI